MLDVENTAKHAFPRVVVIGGSAGSTVIIAEILSALPPHFPFPILVVQHLHSSDDGSFADYLEHRTQLRVAVAHDKQLLEPGCVYVGPANYHMLVERNGTIALSVDERVNWSRPSIDVLFESAAHAYGAKLIAVILSGANHDGARGMMTVRQCGGVTIAQSPDSAEVPVMPQASIDASNPDYVRPPSDIAQLLMKLGTSSMQGRPLNG